MEIATFECKTELLLAIEKLPPTPTALLIFFRSVTGFFQISEQTHEAVHNSALTLHGAKITQFANLSEQCQGTLMVFTAEDLDAILIDSLSLFSPFKGEQHLLLQEEQAIRVEFLLSGLQWLACHDNTHLEYERRWLIQLVVENLDHSSNEKIAMGLLMPPAIQNFVQALEEKFRSCHNVEQYCQEIGTSPRTLGRLMKEHMKMTPKDLITYRVNTEAKQLLLSTHLPVQQLAYQLGFQSSDSFHNFFKRLNNTTPQDYRNHFSIAAKF